MHISVTLSLSLFLFLSPCLIALALGLALSPMRAESKLAKPVFSKKGIPPLLILRAAAAAVKKECVTQTRVATSE